MTLYRKVPSSLDAKITIGIIGPELCETPMSGWKRVVALATKQKIKGSIASLPRYITSNRNPSECEIYRDLGIAVT